MKTNTQDENKQTHKCFRRDWKGITRWRTKMYTGVILIVPMRRTKALKQKRADARICTFDSKDECCLVNDRNETRKTI